MPISTPQTLTVPNTIENGQNSDSPTSSASSSTQTLPPLSPGSPRAIRRKLVVIGDGACGKTSLLVAYKNGTFTSDYLPTVFENSTTTVPIEDKIVDLSLWDTAGQEDYDRLRPLSYPDSHVILICFAIDKRESRDNVARKWFYELQQYCPTVPRLLVGCKSDLRVELAPSLLTTEEEGQDMAQRIGAVSYVECSAKTRHHINEVFAQAARVSLTYQRPKKRSKSTVSRNRKCTIQ